MQLNSRFMKHFTCTIEGQVFSVSVVKEDLEGGICFSGSYVTREGEMKFAYLLAAGNARVFVPSRLPQNILNALMDEIDDQMMWIDN